MTTVIKTNQILVQAPLQTTFEYVSDLSRHPEWSGGLKIEEATPDPIAVGKEYSSHGISVQHLHLSADRRTIDEQVHGSAQSETCANEIKRPDRFIAHQVIQISSPSTTGFPGSHTA